MRLYFIIIILCYFHEVVIINIILNMKSSRSQSTKNIRRNARRFLSESSDDSDNANNSNVDSARAEKVFARRRLPKRCSNLDSLIKTDTDESISMQKEKTLFRVSITSDSESSQCLMDKTESKIKDTSTFDSSIDEFLWKPSKNDLYKYKHVLQSSDDDQSKNSNSNLSNASLESKNSIDSSGSGEDGILEELTNNSVQSSSANVSFLMTPKKLHNKQKMNLNSAVEIDVGSNTSINSEINIILGSESDDDIINSSNELLPTHIKMNHKESEIEKKLKDMSLIEINSSDSDISAHYKSTITSSNQSRPFCEDIKFSNTAHSILNPISQSSILETPYLKEHLENASHVQKNEKSIEVITLSDSPKKSPKQKHPITIDLTGDEFVNSKNLNIEPLRMEKLRLEEIIKRISKNVDKMKNTMKITNLNLLPDGGLKLKKVILKEEGVLEDTKMQLKNVLKKLKDFPEEQKLFPQANLYSTKLSNIDNALTKKAAANIDIHAMGDKALSTYRTQQVMTLDILHSLHKSLETCPGPQVLSEDPQGLKIQLMPHQKYAISWLLWRERQNPHGGVLADDMGLGKTLTMISLILKASEINNLEDSDSDSSENTPCNTIKGGTLIICPASLISQWQNELKTKVRPGILNVVQHYGPNRETSARKLARKDIVITTYHVVMWDLKSHPNTNPIFQIKWNRIILDEAHTIRNYKSQTSIAVSSLSGVNRWAISGTPIHNKETDFYSLLKFIKCRPFDDWAVWKRWVGNNDDAGKNRLSLLVKTLMLRRTKAELSETTSFKLPTKTFHIVNVELAKEEKEAYEKVLLFSSSLFATYLYEKAEKENAVQYGHSLKNKVKHLHLQKLNDNIFQDHPELDKLFKQLMNNKDIQSHHILVLLLRLRQLCCHPCLMKNMLETETLQVDGIQDNGDLDIVDHLSRMSIGIASVEKQNFNNSNPIFKDSWISSKIKSVCDLVKEKVMHTEDKAVIVSQWPSMLYLIRKQLSQLKVHTEVFSGTVPVLQRNKLVDEFNKCKGGPKILLLSLTAGGVGLNLVAANHLFLVDIHWNPQLEAQACDRIYRVGQTKPVNIYKFICTNTIETTIQSIQSNKLAIANNLFGGCNNVEGSKITIDDLKKIFQINPSKKVG